MNTRVERGWCRLVALSMITVMLFGMVGMVGMVGLAAGNTAAAQGPGPAPTVGEIVVDSYTCATGEIRFHVPVTELPSAPEGSNTYQFPLLYNVDSLYEDGSSASANTSRPFVPLAFNPAAADAPYTGNVNLSATVPTTNRSSPQSGTSAITSIDLYVAVGYGGEGADAFNAPTDSSTTTYTVECDEDPGGGTAELIRQLIAVLIQILRELLGR